MFTSWYTQRGNTETDMLRDYGDVHKLVHTERQHRDGYVERLRRCSEVVDCHHIELVHTERQHRDGYVERLRRCSQVVDCHHIELVHTERQHRDGYVERLRRCSQVGTHREATSRRIC